ncbi:MAG: ImmA/IrrE family metallo-endopeptidase [Flavobacteriales bacterium]|nr:ImmA/IrrE family metallo-endopeptidase [Flavobacteriales bacterium]
MPLPNKKAKYKRGFKKWSDDKAIEIRNDLGLSESSPLCAFDVCKHLKIPVLTPNQIPGITEDMLDTLLGKGKKHWSAASIPVKNSYLVVHNPTHAPPRQQSNLMHELAHIICEHKIPIEKINTGLTGFLRNHDQEQEDEAEWFGACLQLPRPALLWALKQRMTEEQIAEHFNASKQMVRYRIGITGVKKQLSYLGY